MSKSGKSLSSWTISEVSSWVDEIGLGELSHKFTSNAVDGEMLSTLSDDDYANEIGATPLQIRKLRTSVARLPGAVTTTAAAGSGPLQPTPRFSAPSTGVSTDFQPMGVENNSKSGGSFSSPYGGFSTSPTMAASGYPMSMPGDYEQLQYPPHGQQPSVIAITQSQQQQQEQKQDRLVMTSSGGCGDGGTAQVALFITGWLLWLPWIAGAFLGCCQRPPPWAFWAWICNIVMAVVGSAVWITFFVLLSEGCFYYYNYC